MAYCINPDCESTNLTNHGKGDDGRGFVFVCRQCGECFDQSDFREYVENKNMDDYEGDPTSEISCNPREAF